ncbi:hypothetical protein NMG60_11014687 [Bertholletia excelsa]
MMSMSVNILSKMLQCSPTHVASVALNTNIFDVALRMNPFNIHGDGLSSSSWLLSGRLANMLLIDCEHDSGCSLTLSVLDFTVQLVERGVENDVVLALVVFSLQYVLVNHEHWKYKVKHARWKVTLKVLEMMKKCILSISHHQKLHEVVRDILFCDSSIHGVLFRIVCITSQALEKLYVIRLYELMEIEGFELAISAAQDIIFCMLSDLSRDILPSLPVFQQAVLSSATKPIPVLTAMLSLISYFRSPTIQAGAAKVLSILFTLADSSQPYVFGNACFGLDEKQISYVRHSIISILSDQSPSNEDLFFATCKMLTSAANYQPAFFVAVIASKENKDVQLNVAHGVKQQNEATIGSLGYKEANLMDVILKFIDQPNDLINSNPRMLLNVLNFIKALWQESAQFTSTLDCLRNSGNFWSQLSKILQSDSNEANRSKNMSGKEVLDMACRCQCQCSVLQILAYETFLEKKLLHAELVIKEASEASKERTEKMDGIKRLSDASLGFTDAFSTFQKGLALENMIKSYASSDYDNGTYHCAKAAAGLLSVHMMGKLKSGNVGSFSVSLIEKIHILLKKMSELPAFSELVAQYTQRGYSDGKELHNLILSDLYYHLQGELEGRKIDAGPFKELYQFLLESNILQTYLRKYDGDLSSCSKSVYLFDSLRLRSDLGLDLWDYSEWKELKVVAETLLLRLEDVNSMMLLSSSKLSALKSLANILSMKDGNSSEKTVIEQNMPQQLILSCIDQVCRFLQVTVESLVPRPDAAQDILDFLAAQVDLLLRLVTYVHGNLSLSTCVLVINTSGSCLKVLSDFRPLISGVKDTTKLLLMLLLSSIKSSCKESQLGGTVGVECIEKSAEASNASLGLLPILCNCVELVDHCTLTLTIVDFILKGLLTPNTWFPIIQKHLQLQHLILKIKDKKSLSSIPVVLKFLLTIARVREGAEMLFTGGFLPSLRMLFADISECESLSIIESERGASNSSDKKERPHCIWGLGLAVVTAMVDSLRDSFSCADVVDYVITYFLEKASLVSYYLSAPEFPSDYHEKKRARAQKTLTSLSFLKGTENTVLLICKLAEHRNSWLKAMKEMDSHLRERSIHLLAFISRGTQYLRESSNKAEPILCHPTLREEYEWYKKPSFVKSKRGWFALSAVCCGVNPRFSVVSSKTSALVVRDREAETTDPASQTYFSDTIAIQVYRIALVLLRFLCLQAEGAVKRAEEVGFVDLAHFPELPMPGILHGLQDQGIAIVTELCEANQSKQVASQIQGVCILLLQITEMALYLEFCVSQICGIRPVLGHVEHFSRELKLLVKAMGGHAFLKGSVKSLKHILSYVYPGLLQTEGFFSSDM